MLLLGFLSVYSSDYFTAEPAFIQFTDATGSSSEQSLSCFAQDSVTLFVCRWGKVLKGQRALQRAQGQISRSRPVRRGETVLCVLGPL